jgi:signal transduction histidine kinase
VTSSFAYRAPDRTFWFSGEGCLWHLVGHDFARVNLPREVANQFAFLQAITKDERGGIWVSFGGHGLYRLADGIWTPYGGRNDLPKTGVMTELTDSLGRVWFGYPKSHLAVLDGDRVRVFGPSEGFQLGNVTAIYGRGSEIWIGGEFGLELFDQGHFHNIAAVNDEWLRGISGIVETANGDLWLNAISGIFHVRKAEISAALRDSNYRVKGEHFGRHEGLPGIAAQLRGLPTAIEGTDGRLWFTLRNGVVWLDPAAYFEKAAPSPPPVTIQSVAADDKSYAPAPRLSLPAHTSNVEVSYSAVSLSDPGAIRFRYKLQETDKDWQEAAAATPVTYRNLPPRSYHFSVKASDTNGDRSDAITTMEFTILPAFYQTGWFIALCVVSALAFLYTLYLLRVRQLARQYGMRLEERVSERTRIARELHDTFLQTIQGSKLVADDALEAPYEPARMRQALKQLSTWLGRAVEEGRAALNSLRTSATETNDLAEGLRRATEECRMLSPVVASFSVDGDAREMHPVVRDEIYRIGYEAIRNASAHSKASRLHVGLKYGQDLAMSVGDNGVGIPESIINGGTDGHYGLQGMRERAARIGGQLRIVSSVDSGTEVSLVIPGRIAFRGTRSTGIE